MTGSKAQIVAEHAGGQWGLITHAQCRRLGVNANDLGRLTARGALVRVIRGVYEVPGHAGDPTTRLPRAGWLALGADRFAHERRARPNPDAVISRSTALALHHVAHPLGERPDITVPKTNIVMHNAVHHTATRRALTWNDTDLIQGLPVMSVGRAINDLVTMKTAPPPHHYLVAALLRAAHAGTHSLTQIARHTAAGVARYHRGHLDTRTFLTTLCTAVSIDNELLTRTIATGRWHQHLDTLTLLEHTTTIIELALHTASDTSHEHTARHRLTSYLTRFDSTIAGRGTTALLCSLPNCERPAAIMTRCTHHHNQAQRHRNRAPEPGRQPTPSGHGHHGILDDNGTTVQCHECGHRYRQLTPGHLARHDLTVADYKTRHGLLQTVALTAEATHTKHVDLGLARSTDHMTHMRNHRPQTTTPRKSN